MRIRSGSVELVAFEPALTQAVHAVRNHPSVREHLRDARPIPWESHARWVEENLIRSRRQHLFVARRAEKPFGITLLRNFEGAQAEIGVMVVEPRRNRHAAYVAAHLIGYYAFEVLGLERVLSYVPRGHREALDFNRRCGFEPAGEASAEYDVLTLSCTSSRTHPAHRRFRERRRIVVERG